MPSPMPQGPPPGAPQGPQSAPPPSPDQGSAGGGAISTLLMNVDKALDHLNLVIGQSKAVGLQEKQMIGQINEMYGQLMDMLGVSGGHDEDGAGAPPPGPGAQGQTVSPEAGGNPGARPA